MDFSLSPEIEQLCARVREFVNREIIPLESDRNNYDAHENIAEQPLARLRDRARAAGLWAPQMPRSRGGMGLPVTAMAALYEEMGRSIFGPVSFNCAAPDDGNMMVVEKVGTDAQKRWWLQPVVDGQVRSALAMTEPAPGSGSDPAGMMLTRAERSGTRWKIYGRKWFITGAGAAKRFIVLARNSDDPRRGLTAFLFDSAQPGWRIVRRIPIMGPEEHGGHCELEFEGLEIEDENVLMGVGDGLKVTQIRLGIARLTHCMRWLGMARRSVEIALDYVRERRSFGCLETLSRPSISAGCSPCAQHGSWSRGILRVPKSRWRRSMSRKHCTRQWTRLCNCRARAATAKTHPLNGCIAMPARRGSSMAHRKFTRWCWPRVH
jgi:acyl-CoA dehydrogenase